MNFVIGFLGLFIYAMYFGYKHDKSKTNESIRVKDYSRYNTLNYEWLNEVTDKELESNINKLVSDYRNDEYVYNKVINVLNTFPNFNESFSNSRRFFDYMLNNHYLMIERILMGEEGKLLKNDAIYGIKSPPIYNENMLKIWMINNDMMKWIDTQLKINGVKYDTKFIDGCCTNSVKYDGSISENIYYINNPIQGKYYWDPMVMML